MSTHINNDEEGDSSIGMAIVHAYVSMMRTSFTQVTEAKTASKKEPEPQQESSNNKVDVDLTEVPETMLWTLHNRGGSVEKGEFQDPKCLEIYQAIDYCYERSFGPSEESHALRSFLFDQHILEFWKTHPHGSVVINLGEGLETQRFRLEEGRKQHNSLFVSVDLPSAIKAREQFIQPDQNHLHIAESAVNVDAWVSQIPQSHKDKPVFITAQGLIMYFELEENKKMFALLAKHFPGATILFDFLSKFASNMTLKDGGWQMTPHYTLPRMPTGANRFDCEALFQSWVHDDDDCKVEYVYWPTDKSNNFFMKYMVPVFIRTPFSSTLSAGHGLGCYISGSQ